MNHPRYTLQPYHGLTTRHTCPSCRKPKEFTRYIDTQTGQYLADHVGRCNREDKCRYHYTPKQYFEEQKSLPNPKPPTKTSSPQKPIPPAPAHSLEGAERQPQTPGIIPFEIFRNSLRKYPDNNFVAYLNLLFDAGLVKQLIQRFYIGASKHWPGATVFWQIDLNYRIRAGKIMLYHSLTGKRVKEPYNHITWVHSILTIKNYTLSQCFFGEHQLKHEPQDKPVAIVESEKTAIIAAAYLPQFIWIATGGKNGCQWKNFRVCKVLLGRKVILFPDLGEAFPQWQTAANTLRQYGINVAVSDLLERKAAVADRQNGLDLADYLTRFTLKEFYNNEFGPEETTSETKQLLPGKLEISADEQLRRLMDTSPLIAKMVELFDLELVGKISIPN